MAAEGRGNNFLLRRGLLAAVMLVLLGLQGGCKLFVLRIHVEPDGSGQMVALSVFDQASLGEFESSESATGQGSSRYVFMDRDRHKWMGKMFGEDVELVEVVPYSHHGREGVAALFQFASISNLSFGVHNDSLEAVYELVTSSDSDYEDFEEVLSQRDELLAEGAIEFEYFPGKTNRLVVTLPLPGKLDSEAGEDEEDLVEAEGEAPESDKKSGSREAEIQELLAVSMGVQPLATGVDVYYRDNMGFDADEDYLPRRIDISVSVGGDLLPVITGAPGVVESNRVVLARGVFTEAEVDRHVSRYDMRGNVGGLAGYRAFRMLAQSSADLMIETNQQVVIEFK